MNLLPEMLQTVRVTESGTVYSRIPFLLIDQIRNLQIQGQIRFIVRRIAGPL